MHKTLMPKPSVQKEKNQAKRSINLLGGLTFVCLFVLFAAVFIPEGKSAEEYLQELFDRKEAGELLPSGEEKDYCMLMATLHASVSLACLPMLEGIFSKTDHWHRYNPHPDKKGKWKYIDKSGKPIAGQNKSTHIRID